MGANLYFMSGDRAVGMSEHRYDSEDILQKIIADNPGLLLRDTDPTGSCLMLVTREFEVAEGDDSYNAYYLDHLLVDQSGVPVLVEVKRSTDTRTRREVVAQMLDYASRVSSWDVNELRELFRQNNDEPGTLEAYEGGSLDFFDLHRLYGLSADGTQVGAVVVAEFRGVVAVGQDEDFFRVRVDGSKLYVGNPRPVQASDFRGPFTGAELVVPLCRYHSCLVEHVVCGFRRHLAHISFHLSLV